MSSNVEYVWLPPRVLDVAMMKRTLQFWKELEHSNRFLALATTP
jgi:hypothetical protein